jgi:hypothetical protein
MLKWLKIDTNVNHEDYNVKKHEKQRFVQFAVDFFDRWVSPLALTKGQINKTRRGAKLQTVAEITRATVGGSLRPNALTRVTVSAVQMKEASEPNTENPMRQSEPMSPLPEEAEAVDEESSSDDEGPYAFTANREGRRSSARPSNGRPSAGRPLAGRPSAQRGSATGTQRPAGEGRVEERPSIHFYERSAV